MSLDHCSICRNPVDTDQDVDCYFAPGLLGKCVCWRCWEKEFGPITEGRKPMETQASNDNSTSQTQTTPDGPWGPSEQIPFASRWEVIRQELRVLWSGITGRLGRDE